MARWRDVLFWAALAVVAAIAVFFGTAAWQGARKAAIESGQRSLLLQAERQLAAYHSEHGEYPESLAGLRFQFHDGADASTFERIEYRTDGEYYRMVTKSDWDGSEMSVCH